MNRDETYAFSLFNGIIEFVAQDGYNIDFINDVDFALLSRNFGQAADYYTVYQFIAHFASKFGSLKIFLYVPYKFIGTLYRVFPLRLSLFQVPQFHIQAFSAHRNIFV